MSRPQVALKIEEFQKDKKIINMFEMGKFLNYEIKEINFDKSYLAAKIYNNKNKTEDNNYKAVIELSKKIDINTQNTLLAILISEHILNDMKFSQGYVLEYEVFQLKEFRRNQFAKTVQLALRIAVPPEIINQFDDLKFHRDNYAREAKLTQEFISCVVKDHSLDFLMSNELIWNTLETKKHTSENIKKNI